MDDRTACTQMQVQKLPQLDVVRLRLKSLFDDRMMTGLKHQFGEMHARACVSGSSRRISQFRVLARHSDASNALFDMLSFQRLQRDSAISIPSPRTDHLNKEHFHVFG
jgi:hypothetical protein